METRDVAELRTLYDEGAVQDGWLDWFGQDVLEPYVLVDEDGALLGAMAARLVPEFVLVLGKGHPAARMSWLRRLAGTVKARLLARGYTRALAVLPADLARPWGRRLQQLDPRWRPGHVLYVYVAEGADVDWQRGQGAGAGECGHRADDSQQRGQQRREPVRDGRADPAE
jgi:hypothetical protein